MSTSNWSGPGKKVCPFCREEFPSDTQVCPQDGAELFYPKADQLIGSLLAERYEVLSLLGRGGMGRVYAGRHKLLSRPVAIKVLDAKMSDSGVNFKRFEQEARATSLLSHPHLVGVFDYGFMLDGEPYLVMDLIPGTSLAAVLDEQGQLPIERAIPLICQICDAVGYLHNKGVIHRDLKPGNILLTEIDGQTDFVKLIDLGVATFLPQFDLQPEKLTLQGQCVGSVYYMSPEACLGDKADVRSDIYMLGCVIYETVAGLPPIRGNSPIETMQKHVEQGPPALKQTRTDLEFPEKFERIVRKCLQRNPDDRYQTMQELKQDLSRILVPDMVQSGPAKATLPAELVVKPSRSEPPAVSRASNSRLRNMEPALTTTPARSGHFPGSTVMLAVLVLVVAAAALVFVVNRQSQGHASETANQSDDTWKQYDRAGQNALDSGDFPNAEKQFQLEVKQTEKFGPADKRFILSLRKLGDAYYAQGKYQDAERIDERLRALRTASAAAAAGTAQTADASPKDDRLVKIARMCHSHGKCDVAEQLLQKSIAVAQSAYGPDSPKTMDRLHDLASFYESIGMQTKAEPLLKRIAAMKANAAIR